MTESSGPPVAAVTGEVLASMLYRGRHAHRDFCPVCTDSIATTGVSSLAYTFDVCTCGEPEFPHLIEVIWHTACLVGSQPMRGTAELDDLLETLQASTGRGYIKVTDRRRIDNAVAAVRRAQRDPRPCPYCIGAAFPCGASPDDPDHEPMTCETCETERANLAEPHADCLRSVAEYEEQRRRDGDLT